MDDRRMKPEAYLEQSSGNHVIALYEEDIGSGYETVLGYSIEYQTVFRSKWKFVDGKAYMTKKGILIPMIKDKATSKRMFTRRGIDFLYKRLEKNLTEMEGNMKRLSEYSNTYEALIHIEELLATKTFSY